MGGVFLRCFLVGFSSISRVLGCALRARITRIELLFNRTGSYNLASFFSVFTVLPLLFPV